MNGWANKVTIDVPTRSPAGCRNIIWSFRYNLIRSLPCKIKIWYYYTVLIFYHIFCHLSILFLGKSILDNYQTEQITWPSSFLTRSLLQEHSTNTGEAFYGFTCSAATDRKMFPFLRRREKVVKTFPTCVLFNYVWHVRHETIAFHIIIINAKPKSQSAVSPACNSAPFPLLYLPPAA